MRQRWLDLATGAFVLFLVTQLQWRLVPPIAFNVLAGVFVAAYLWQSALAARDEELGEKPPVDPAGRWVAILAVFALLGYLGWRLSGG